LLALGARRLPCDPASSEASLTVSSQPIETTAPRSVDALAVLARRYGGPFKIFARYGRARERPLRVLTRMAWLHVNKLAGRRFVFTLHGDVRLKVQYDFGSPILAYYLGLYENASMNFLVRYLRPGDIFADVGANIGVYSMLAAIVSRANVHAFEPVTSAYEALGDNIALNGIWKSVTVHKKGVGSAAGIALITTNRHGANSIVRMNVDDPVEKIEIVTLDAAMAATPPNVIKIDVEGFEEEVLRGAKNILANARLNVVIVEAVCRQEGDADRIARFTDLLGGCGFHPYRFDPTAGSLIPCAGRDKFVGPDDENYLFVRDVGKVAQRVSGPIL
jgi:FkbM family methyltransferase